MDRKFFEAIRQGMEQMRMSEAKSSESGPVDKAHYCATHVEHAEHGQGVCISEEHAEPAEDGSIEWYTVQFEGKEPMVVKTTEMKILQAESHMHSKKKKMAEETEEQIEEAMSSEFKKAFANVPKGVEVHMHHPKTNRVTKEKFFGTHNAVKAASKHISDMQKLGWKVKEKKLIESEEHIEEAMQKSDVPAYLRKEKGEKPLTVADVKGPRADSISSKEALAKARNEEVEIEEAKAHTVPKTEKEKDLAAMAEPKDKITHADVMVGRGVGKKNMEEMSSKEKMKRGLYNKEEVEAEQYAEIVEKFDDFEVEVKESYTFAEYVEAAKKLVAEEEVIAAADKAYRSKDIDFVVEAFTQADIESKVDAHRKAGNKVSMPTFGKKAGQPYAEYTVTDKEGQKRKYIHHGKTRKVETLG